MRIQCWGSRGSIPVSGKQYLKYGGDTTCLEIRTKSEHTIVVDAGTGIRRLGKQVIQENRFQYHFIFTHAHWDHILGFPFFKPLYNKEAELIIYRCPYNETKVEKMITKVIAPPNFPLKYEDISAAIHYEDSSPESFDIGSVNIIPVKLSHPNRGKGYKFVEEDKTFVFLTDNELEYLHPGGHAKQDYIEFARGADLLFHDAEYTPEEYKRFVEFGHSAYTHVIDMALAADIKKLGLFHLNQDRTDKEMDRIVEHCKKIIAEKGGKHMDCFAVGADMSFTL